MPINTEDTREADLTAESLLLLRLALNDGEASEQAMAVIRRVGWRAFGIDALSMNRLEAVIAAYNADNAKAGKEFRAKSETERLRLANMLLSVARHDETLREREGRLRGRLAVLLDLEEAKLG